MNTLRILVADDHEIVRRGLVSLLKSHLGWEVCGEAQDGREAVEKAKEVGARAHVSAILTASPYYNRPKQEGQYAHFRAIAEAVDKPLILYNVPGRTSANIEPATLARLAEVPNILGVKEASGNMSQIADVLNAVPETFLVFSGDDAITLPVIALGGVGWGSATDGKPLGNSPLK